MGEAKEKEEEEDKYMSLKLDLPLSLLMVANPTGRRPNYAVVICGSEFVSFFPSPEKKLIQENHVVVVVLGEFA